MDFQDDTRGSKDGKRERGDRAERGERAERGDGILKKGGRSKYRPEYPGDFEFNYKDPLTLSRFIMEGGKVIPSRISKMSMAQQKRVSAAIRKARCLALLPVGSDAYDRFGRSPEPISPVPFDWK